MPDWLREIDHTADMGIEISADSREGLFVRAGIGMFHMITDLGSVHPKKAVHVYVTGSDIESLLLQWLSQLNFLHLTSTWLFKNFEIKMLSETECKATAFGEHFDGAKHEIFTEIKAVTFHGLQVKQEKKQWHARIIFDL